MTMAQRIWLITGISSGFGRHLTEQLLDRGDHVIGTVRKPDAVADLTEKYPDLLRVEVLDVRDTAALRDAVERTVADLGRIDVAISNAGYGVFGAAEELTDEQVEAILATNLTASIQLIRAVLPHMRQARGGRIIQLSSYGKGLDGRRVAAAI
jgi:NAD(P)-dependent dehydrogenase (short-subunit alcohol dehydrogenase family)